jgi:IMP dehydrogenase
MELGRGKKTRRAYGFDEIALVPNGNTLDFELCDTSWSIGKHKFATPIIASAMDGVVSPDNASVISAEGALAVLNLQGIYTRYTREAYNIILDEIAASSKDDFVSLMQKVYSEPVKDELIINVIQEMKLKAQGRPVAVSISPNTANRYAAICEQAGVDIIIIQSTVVGLEHKSVPERIAKDPSIELDLTKFCKERKVPVVVGNCVDYEIARKLMETGISALLVGIGPGAACTSRGVLGIGVPMATAIADCRAARDEHFAASAKYVPIIADGGMAVGGDICKAIACGADAVMIGSPFARTLEAPGRGFHWGMATPSPVLPRGTRIEVGTECSTHELLHGPAKLDDGSHNLVGALKTSMSTLGASNLREMQDVEVIIAPSLLTEGKVYQKAQKLGMGKK